MTPDFEKQAIRLTGRLDEALNHCQQNLRIQRERILRYIGYEYLAGEGVA